MTTRKTLALLAPLIAVSVHAHAQSCMDRVGCRTELACRLALSLDLSGLDAGAYELRIDVSAGDGGTATTIRTFRLEG